jgi:hypothetical protein
MWIMSAANAYDPCWKLCRVCIGGRISGTGKDRSANPGLTSEEVSKVLTSSDHRLGSIDEYGSDPGVKAIRTFDGRLRSRSGRARLHCLPGATPRQAGLH